MFLVAFPPPKRSAFSDFIDCHYVTVGESIERDMDCVPLVSEYTDCSEANICSGCSRCTCTVDGNWSCKIVHECPSSGDEDLFGEETISNAYEVLFNELASLDSTTAAPVRKTDESRLLGAHRNLDIQRGEQYEMTRAKRSLNHNPKKKDLNGTVRFYHTVDELNEDTLKYNNESGTIVAKAVEGEKIPEISRRTSPLDSSNVTGISDLHIDFNQPRDYDHHIADNKIDSVAQTEHKVNLLGGAKMSEIIGNYSQTAKDKDLSKLVVNEMKKGSETIGDKRAVPVSNVTFTPENDTLTAMAYIAGSLLSKLWRIEKDSSAESIETEVLKHEKIADLLELFKEPLTMRQEVFIKNALNRISKALNKENNISLCEALASTEYSSNSSNEDVARVNVPCKADKSKRNPNTSHRMDNITVQAITKISDVLNLMNKFENVQKRLHLLRSNVPSSSEQSKSKENLHFNIKESENKSLNVFGDLLERITKLILPKKSKKSKKLITQIRHMNLFGNSREIQKELKQIIGIHNDSATLNSKDKLVIDYLNVFKTTDCTLRGNLRKEINSSPNISGNLVDTLTNILKIKSLNDLTDLIRPKPEISYENQPMSPRSEKLKSHTAETSFDTRNNNNEDEETIKNAKDKLRKHLNAILDDLVELQGQNGITLRDNNRTVADVLPCIYNLLNAGNETEEKSRNSTDPSFTKIKKMFESLKNNLQHGSLSRRSGYDFAEPSQSSRVWERIIKNLNKQNTRRNFNGRPKSFDKLKQIIDDVDLSSNSYKDYLTLSDVPVASHLILLKVIQASVNRIANTLQDIKLYLDTTIKLSNEEEFKLQRFVDNAVQSINFNNNILDKLKERERKTILENSKRLRADKISKQLMQMSVLDAAERPIEDAANIPKISNLNDKLIHKLRSHKFDNKGDSANRPKQLSNYKQLGKISEGLNEFKLTRNQILNQLIKNRLQLYLQMKEAKRANLNQDVNYNLANRIYNKLESGNNNLAKDLFGAFIRNSENVELYRVANKYEAQTSSITDDQVPTSTPAPSKFEVSKMKFEDYLDDNLLRQLLTMMKL